MSAAGCPIEYQSILVNGGCARERVLALRRVWSVQPEEPGAELPSGFSAATGWQAMVFAGVVTVILGLIVALHPSGSLNVIAVLLGILLVISGIFDLVRVFDRSETHRVWLGIAGLLLVVIGVLLIRHLDLTVALVGLVIGITWIVQGLAELADAFSGGPGERRGLVDLLRAHQPHRRDRGRRGADDLGDGAGGAGRDLVHHHGPSPDRRRVHATARG